MLYAQAVRGRGIEGIENVVNLWFVAEKDNIQVGLLTQNLQGRGYRDAGTKVPAHGVNGKTERVSQKNTFGRRGISVFGRSNYFLAAVKTVGSHMVTAVFLTTHLVHGQGGTTQGIMGTTHATLGTGFTILLNGHLILLLKTVC